MTGHALALATLLGLFVLRVIGQPIVIVWSPRWLPPNREWYSGLLPYPVLLPVQIVFIAVMTIITLHTARGGTWAEPRPALGTVFMWLSFVYAAGMVVRFIVWLRRPPAQRRAWVPIIFHLVLAAFLFVYARVLMGA